MKGRGVRREKENQEKIDLGAKKEKESGYQ